jgi:thioredoxin 1
MKLAPMFLSLVFLCSVSAKVTTIEKECDFKTKITGKKPVVCKFYAPWCGPCKASGPVVQELSDDRPDLEFIEVSHEGGEDSKKLFNDNNVRSFPTFVIFKDGKKIGSFAGFKQKDELAKVIDEIIKNPEAAKASAVERLDVEAGLRPEDVKKFEAIQNFMASLASGNQDEIKKHITKESVNYIIESPMMDLNIIFLLIMNEVEKADELIDYALSLKPDLTKELNIGGKKQTLKKHLDDMSSSLQKKINLINKVVKKLPACPVDAKSSKK